MKSRRRITRLEREIRVLESLDTRLWKLEWLRAALVIISGCLATAALYWLIFFYFESHWIALAVCAAVTFVGIFAFRYPLKFFVVLTILVIALFLAVLFDDDLGIMDWPTDPKNQKQFKKHSLRDRVSVAIHKRKAQIKILEHDNSM